MLYILGDKTFETDFNFIFSPLKQLDYKTDIGHLALIIFMN